MDVTIGRNYINNNNSNLLKAAYSANNTTNLSATNTLDLSKIYETMAKKYGVNNAAASESSKQMYKLKDAGNSLFEQISKLTAKGAKSAFDTTSPVSSDEKAMEVVATQTTTKTAKTKPTDEIKVEIKQVALAQVNAGSAQKDAEKLVANGKYKLEVEVSGKKQTVEINVEAKDNSKSIQQKLALAINDKKLGVSATAASDKTSKTTFLSVQSDKTGTTDVKKPSDTPVFTIKDVSGNLAEKLGLSNTTQTAQNASYSVNGSEIQTSATNKVKIAEGVEATLKSASKDVSVNYEKNNDQAISAVVEVVNKVNTLLSDAKQTAKDTATRGAIRLSNDIAGTNKTYKSSLSKVGIDVSSDGKLTIDTEKLKVSANNGKLQKLFGESYGFAKRTENVAKDLKGGSAYYSNSGTQSVKLQNSNSLKTVNNPYSNMGLMFDMMF